MSRRIEDELNPVRVGENKYRIADGRIVSRQYINQVRNPLKTRARRERYMKAKKAALLDS